MVAANRPRPGSVRRHFAIAVRNLVASVYVLGRWWEFLLTPVLMIGINSKARPPAAPFPFCATLFGGKMGIKPNFMKSPNQRGEWTEARFALALNFLSSSLHLLEKPWSDGSAGGDTGSFDFAGRIVGRDSACFPQDDKFLGFGLHLDPAKLVSQCGGELAYYLPL